MKATTYLYSLFYCNLKETDHIRGKINSKKIFVCEICIIIIILICGKQVLIGLVQQKVKLPLP